MNSYETRTWPGIVRFKCMCGYKQAYKISDNNEKDINAAEDNFVKVHAKACTKR